MFDFGNKKEIETLKQVIAKLTFENMEKDKTVDYLIGKVNKLSNRVKELEEELEKEKEYSEPIIDNSITITLENDEKEYNCIELQDIDYIEVKDFFDKINDYCILDDEKYKITYFLINKNILTTEYIKKMIKNKKIPMYNGIPFRKIQDLYKIMNFLESEKNINFLNEVRHANLKNISFEKINNILYVKSGKTIITDKIIKKIISNNYYKLKNFEIYNQKEVLFYNNIPFFNCKELKKIIKKECYHNRNILNKIIKVLNN